MGRIGVGTILLLLLGLVGVTGFQRVRARRAEE